MRNLRLVFAVIIFSVAVSFALAQSDPCEGWGGVKVDGEFVCCTCAGEDGWCPEDVVPGVCVYGDSDCGNCDIPPTGTPTITIDSISWSSKIYNPSDQATPLYGKFSFVKPKFPTWIRGNSVLFNGTGTDNVGGRGMDDLGFKLYVNSTPYPISSAQTTGNPGDLVMHAWYYLDTTPLSDGKSHNFVLYGQDMAGNGAYSTAVNARVCNDLDIPTCSDACTDSNFLWNIGGEVPTGNSTCCGDDDFEFRILNNETTDDYACCDNLTDCAVQDICFPLGSKITIDGVRYVCGPEHLVTRLCEIPSDVGEVDAFGDCCSLTMSAIPTQAKATNNYGRVTYFLMDNSSIPTNDERFSMQVPSGCFDGLDTNCDGTVQDTNPSICPFEGMYLDDPSIDFDDWYSHYQNDYGSPIPDTDYNTAVVRDRNCLDDLDNDKSWDDANIAEFCKEEGLSYDSKSNKENYWDRKCSNETSDDYPEFMFDLLDNDCDNFIDFGKVPNLDSNNQGDFIRVEPYTPSSANWMNFDQAEELFENNSKIKVTGRLTDPLGVGLPNVNIIARLSQNDWYPASNARNKTVQQDVQAAVPITYFNTYTDKNGDYELYINRKTNYNLYANFSNPEYEANYIVPHKNIRSSDEWMKFGSDLEVIEQNLRAIDADLVQCNGCTLAGTNRCYAGCMRNDSACPFVPEDWVDKDKFIFACSDLPAGTLAYYGDNRYVLCCNGSSLIEMPADVEPIAVLDENVENAVRYTKAVTLYGVPVKMRVVLIESKS